MPTSLSGVRILDLTQVMAGPFCCQILGDLGADVLKVEPLGRGDSSRSSMGTVLPGGESSAFLALNRNKRSITIDLKNPDGKALFLRLAQDADVLVENFRPGVTERLGIDYAAVRSVNPRLVYASISGFGHNGPYASRAGYDLIAQALSGVMSVTGEPGADPVKCGLPVADLSAGLFCAIGILSAYVAVQTTGTGQHVDVALYDSALALSVWETAELWATGVVPQPTGSANRMSAPYEKLRTRDGHLVVGANNERLWVKLCAALGRDELPSDVRFSTNAQRMHNRAQLVTELERSLAARDTQDWVAALLEQGVPAAAIRDYEQACADPQTLAREMVIEVPHPTEGVVRNLGIPVKLSETPGGVRRPAPLLGQHTDEVLEGLGYSAQERGRLREQGVVS